VCHSAPFGPPGPPGGAHGERRPVGVGAKEVVRRRREPVSAPRSASRLCNATVTIRLRRRVDPGGYANYGGQLSIIRTPSGGGASRLPTRWGRGSGGAPRPPARWGPGGPGVRWRPPATGAMGAGVRWRPRRDPRARRDARRVSVTRLRRSVFVDEWTPEGMRITAASCRLFAHPLWWWSVAAPGALGRGSVAPTSRLRARWAGGPWRPRRGYGRDGPGVRGAHVAATGALGRGSVAPTSRLRARWAGGAVAPTSRLRARWAGGGRGAHVAATGAMGRGGHGAHVAATGRAATLARAGPLTPACARPRARSRLASPGRRRRPGNRKSARGRPGAGSASPRSRSRCRGTPGARRGTRARRPRWRR